MPLAGTTQLVTNTWDMQPETSTVRSKYSQSYRTHERCRRFKLKIRHLTTSMSYPGLFLLFLPISLQLPSPPPLFFSPFSISCPSLQSLALNSELKNVKRHPVAEEEAAPAWSSKLVQNNNVPSEQGEWFHLVQHQHSADEQQHGVPAGLCQDHSDTNVPWASRATQCST